MNSQAFFETSTKMQVPVVTLVDTPPVATAPPVATVATVLPGGVESEIVTVSSL